MMIIIKIIIICISIIFTSVLVANNNSNKYSEKVLIRPSKFFITGMFSGLLLCLIVVEIIIKFTNFTISTNNFIGSFSILSMIALIIYNMVKFLTLKIYLAYDRIILKTLFMRREYLFKDYICDEFGYMTEENDIIFYYLRFREPKGEVKVNIDYYNNKDRQILSNMLSKFLSDKINLIHNKYETKTAIIIKTILGYLLFIVGLLL